MRNLFCVFCAVLMFSAGAVSQAQAGSFWDGLFSSGPKQSKAVTALSQNDVQEALREALVVSSQSVVTKLGRTGGFNSDKNIRIPLPAALQPVDKILKSVGMGALTADLEGRLNKAAELATPKTQQILLDTIYKMTLSDAKAILTGGDNAATAYLRKSAGTQLKDAMRPIVTEALEDAGAVQAYDLAMTRYQTAMPMLPDVKANLTDYATDKALDGIFYYIAQEEAALRKEPIKATSKLVEKVFSAVK
ncbi:MAG: DUF4197 domain-containing protein [Alphaproteobacteria bacterium]|nr:DUF4197 domain-containing protein [Alphaproteobacteria bacterium]